MLTGPPTFTQVSVAALLTKPAPKAVQEVLSELPDVVEVRRDETGVWMIGAQRGVREDASRALVADGWIPVHLHLRADELTDVYHQFFVDEDEYDDDEFS